MLRASDLDLKRFAIVVQSIVDNMPQTLGHGPSKVFVSTAYNAFVDWFEEFINISLDEFKELLLRAHRGFLLKLTRLDLPGSWGTSQAYKKSQIVYGLDDLASYHLISRSKNQY